VQRSTHIKVWFLLVALGAAAVLPCAARGQSANTAVKTPGTPTAPTAPNADATIKQTQAARLAALAAARKRMRRLAEAHAKQSVEAASAGGRSGVSLPLQPSPSSVAALSGAAPAKPTTNTGDHGDQPLGQTDGHTLFAGQSNTPLGQVDRGKTKNSTFGHMASTGSWILNTLTALGIVVGLILLLRYLWVKMGGRVVASHSPVVEVLSRTAVAPKNHVLLLRVGQRVLVVSDSNAGLRTLAQVVEPEEVADLLTSVTTSREQSISKNFSQLLSRFNGDYEKPHLAEEGGDDTEFELDRARDRLSGLVSRIRTIAQGNKTG